MTPLDATLLLVPLVAAALIACVLFTLGMVNIVVGIRARLTTDEEGRGKITTGITQSAVAVLALPLVALILTLIQRTTPA